MDLPDLPRKLDKREAKITPFVEKWFLDNYDNDVLVEVKATNTNTVPYSAVKPHQLLALRAARSQVGICHKMSDAARIRQPADFWMLKNAKSFVVICFLKERVCLAIHPDKWEGANINTECEFKIEL